MIMTTQNKTLRVVCSGTGYFSQLHYDAWQRISAKNERIQVLGVCNRSIEGAETTAARFGIANTDTDLERLIVETDANLVDIITPPVTHLDAIKVCASLRVNAICQKPFGENQAQAEEIIRIAEAAGIDVIVHENFRFMPWYRAAKKVLDQGRLGDILNAEFKLRPGDGQGDDAYLSRQPYFQDMPRFLVHETGIHFIDTFRFLLGEPTSVYADLRQCNPVIKGEDAANILMTFPNSLRVHINANRLLDHATSNTRRTMGELEISGTKGALNVDGEGRVYFRKFGEHLPEEIPYEWKDIHFGGDCVFNTVEHITQHLLNGEEPENTAQAYMRNISIENAIYKSAELGQNIIL